jgi:hypothetical protein
MKIRLRKSRLPKNTPDHIRELFQVADKSFNKWNEERKKREFEQTRRSCTETLNRLGMRFNDGTDVLPHNEPLSPHR